MRSQQNNNNRNILIPHVVIGSAVMLAAMMLGCSANPAGAAEYRAFWVDAWGAGFLNQSQVDTLLGVPGTSTQGRIREANCNMVIVQVRRRFDVCYPSGVGEPYMSGLTPASFNALEAMIKAAHDTTDGKKRVEVHCWSVAFKTAKGLVYTQHSDPPTGSLTTFDNYWPTRVSSTTGAENGDGAFDPGHPKCLEYLVNAHMDLVNFQTTAGPDGTDGDIDGIHYDYIRFEASSEGYNPTSVARYNARYGLTGDPASTSEQFKQWRRDQVTAFVRQMYARVQKTKPWVKQSGSFVTWNPSPTSSTRSGFQATRPYYDVYSDWDSWQQEGIIDMAVPMTYYNWASLPNDYTRWMNFEKDRKFNRHMIVDPGVYLNSLANAIYELQMTRDASPAGNYAHGFSGYSYRVPYSGGSWSGFSPSLVSDVTPAWDDIPDMPWKTAPTKGHIMGTVTIAGTGAWADSAIVSITGPANRSMYVDGTGFYAFIDLPPGTYAVTASKSGYADSQGSVTVAIGQVTGNMYEQNFVLGTTAPPTITSEPQSLTIAQGSNAMFSVSAIGEAPLAYQWRFDNADIAGATTNSYTRVNAQTSHAGSYSVVVTNSLGSVTSSAAMLTVIVPPTITNQPVSQAVTQGVNVSFSVAAAGTAPFGYQWRFNDSPLPGKTASVLTLSNVQPADAGSYSAVVSNFAGTATSANAVLTVYQAPVPPTITSQPADQRVSAGQMVTLSVGVSGAEPLAYQWLFNGGTIGGATASQLILDNVQTNQSGGYSIVVTNEYDAVTSRTALLTVDPAFIPEGLRLLWSLAPGSRSYLTAVAGSPPNERGMAYNPLTRRVLVVSRTSPMVYVLDGDTGADLWTLDKTGVTGGYTSAYYLLMAGVADDGVVYACNLTLNPSSVPFKIYRWANDGPGTLPTVAYSGDAGAGNVQRWGDTFDVRGAGNNTQIIIGSRSGNVVAVLSTTNGTTFTSKLITVADAPTGAFGLGIAFGAGNTFWGKATSQNLRQVSFDLAAGNGTTIRSYADPSFPATVAPIGVTTDLNLLGGINLATAGNGNHFRLYDLAPTLTNGTPAFITATNFATDNENTYSGTGSVDFGGDRVYALSSNNGLLAMQIIPLVVNVPPTITAQPQDQTVVSGQNASFSVTATGTAPLAYQWYYGGLPVADATDSNFTITNAQPAMAGNYFVEVLNVAGQVTSSNASLTVSQLIPPQVDSISLLPGGQVQLQVSGDPGHYGVDATTNLMVVDWTELTNFTTIVMPFQYVDPDTNLAQRFYRVRRLP